MIRTPRSEIRGARAALSLICGAVDFSSTLFLCPRRPCTFHCLRESSCFESRGCRAVRISPAPGYIPASASNLPIDDEARQVAVSLCRLNCFEEALLLFIHRETTMLEINGTIRGSSRILGLGCSNGGQLWTSCLACTTLENVMVSRVGCTFIFYFSFCSGKRVWSLIRMRWGLA